MMFSRESEPDWWKSSVVYQVYPRSFYDTNGDGVGDLRGVIEKVPYLKSLGVDIVWLNPIFMTPNDDMGYDISDYTKINPEFGAMEDFDELLTTLHAAGLKLILDLVVNHTSDEHEWFVDAKSSRSSKYRDFYIWWPEEKGSPPERYSFFDSNGSAWEYDQATKSYYLHLFSKKQPDLNWDNPVVRKEIYRMMEYWFDKGIDGFRMDVITYISKEIPFTEPIKGVELFDWEEFYSMGPKLHEYLQEMHDEVLSKYDIMTVAEGPGINPENVLPMIKDDGSELNMAYHFDHTNMGLRPRRMWSDEARNMVEFKNINRRWMKVLERGGWIGTFLGNHDQPRMVTRWGNDSEAFRKKSSMLLNTYLLTMPGTPFCYMGDELGMTNPRFDDIADYRDIETLNWYQMVLSEGGDLEKFMESHKITARDNGRTPIQWDSTRNAGFSSCDPWLKMNENFAEINVESQESDPESCLNYFRKLVQIRKKYDALVHGDFQEHDEGHQAIYSYSRKHQDQRLLIILNFSDQTSTIQLDRSFDSISLVSSNYIECSLDNTGSVTVSPWQASIYQFN